jgi:hypothetical protein
MKKIGFIGTFDKTDFIIQIAKILTVIGKKVIVIDSTVNQKAKYIVPVINPTRTYITEFEEIDVAVGFKDFEEIKNYLGLGEYEQLDYDIALIDIDSDKVFEDFKMMEASKNYFVTSFDLFSLRKGLEILSGMKQTIQMTKILFSKDMTKEEDDYLNFLSSEYRILWDEIKIYFPFELGDQSVIIENQRVAKIKFRNLSAQYKESLIYVTEQIVENISINELKKIMKNIEKGA